MNSPALSAALALTMVLGLVSCSSVKTTMKKVTAPIKSMANSERNRKTDIPPIVVVRKDDLRKIQSGQEKIADWNRSRKSLSPSVAFLPEDFDPFKLPASGILPPLTPGDSSSAGIATPDGDLPSDIADLPEELPVEEENE